MNYRKEIDGLRAVAVLPVLLYHAGFQHFSGGFVGVDVFFVISGFLITGIILQALRAQQFSLIDFYERRARRILPALYVVMLFTLVVSWWLLPAKDMKSFSSALVAVSVFASNILFRITTNYFDATSDLNPLIHTWSLSVEEQYYMLFPLLVCWLWKRQPRWLLPALLTLFVVSLTYAQTHVVPQPVKTFFLLPSRTWELLIGAIAATWLFEFGQPRLPHLVRQSLALLGLVLILASVCWFDDHVPAPSLYTLAPTLGAACLLVFATQQTWVGQLLAQRWLVGIGLISYSTYLWHQPLFAFARHAIIDTLSPLTFLSLILASFLLAYFSWKYIETPFRNRQRISRRQLIQCTVSAAALFIAIGLAGFFSKGFAFRLAPEKAAFLDYFENAMPQMRYFQRANILQTYRIQCDFYDIEKSKLGESTSQPVAKIAEECYQPDRLKTHRVMLWGDSHAQHLYGGLSHHLAQDWQILQVASSGCTPKLQFSQNPDDYCDTSNWFAWQTMLKAKPEVVVIAQNKQHQPDTLIAIAQALHAHGVKRVLLVGPSPHWRRDLPKLVTYWLWDNTPERTHFGVDPHYIARDQQMQQVFSQQAALEYISMMDTFCNTAGCLVYVGTDKQSGLTTWDYGHLTSAASDFFAQQRLANAITQSTTSAASLKP